MNAPSLRRFVITVARTCAEGMMMTDPALCACYVRCKAELDESASLAANVRVEDGWRQRLPLTVVDAARGVSG